MITIATIISLASRFFIKPNIFILTFIVEAKKFIPPHPNPLPLGERDSSFPPSLDGRGCRGG